MDAHDQTITLMDGRKLGFALYGPVSGQPVLYFHGTPSSRLEPQLLNVYGVDLEAILFTANIQLIAIDRPGIGLSSFNSGGNFLSFAEDVKQLIDQLSVRACSILCWSGGGPYALAMAHQFPGTINIVFILCGFSRHFDEEVFRQMGFNKGYFRLAKYTPWLLRALMNILKNKEIAGFVPQKFTGLAYVDYALLKDIPRLRVVAKTTVKEACRNGSKGPVYEAQSYYNDFGFSLSAIRQPVHYWWGTLDMSVDRVHAEAIEQQVPNAIMHYRQNEGHLSMYIKGFEEAMKIIKTNDANQSFN